MLTMPVYDSLVTVTAAGSDGQYFKGWTTNGTDTGIVSMASEYSFYASQNMTLTALYSDEVVTAKPIVTISQLFDAGRVSFMVERSIPSGYSMVSSGIIAVKGISAMNETYNLDTMVIDNVGNVSYSGLIKGTTYDGTANGQYVAILSNCDYAVARGYLVYRNDATGATETAYTGVAGVSKSEVNVVAPTGTTTTYEAPGQEVTVTAADIAGKTFLGWYVGSSLVSASSEYTFTVTDDITLEAVYEDVEYTVTVEYVTNTGWETEIDRYALYGESYTVSAYEVTGRTFVGWYVNNTLVSNNSEYTFTVTGDVTLVAVYE